MGLTILAIPLIMLGVFIKPYALESSRCVGIGARAFCFAHDSSMPEVIKYGSILAGFAMIYAGRLQIKRRRGGQ